MIKFNHDWIRPFQISTPAEKGGENQLYLQRCYQEVAELGYELLYPFEDQRELPEVVPGVVELKLKGELTTPPGTSMLITTHPDAVTGRVPFVIPTCFQTDWWAGDIKVWMVKSELILNHRDPVALLLVIKRNKGVVAEQNDEEKARVAAFQAYVDENREKLITRDDNLYERMSWLVETNKLTFRPRKKYKIL